ncbi:hypothetical protein HDU84_006585 [Entophlyctis sp. JEL0112]|nr:hypothetical protein HDU84_006585 [Entophlyctis sp. JEL0112]
MDSTAFDIRVSRHVALRLALNYIRALGVDSSATLSDIAKSLSSEEHEASIQTAYLDLPEDLSLTSIVEEFLTKRNRSKTNGASEKRLLPSWMECKNIVAEPVCQIPVDSPVLALSSRGSTYWSSHSSKSVLISETEETAGKPFNLQSPALAISQHPTDESIAAVALMDGSMHIVQSTPSVQILQSFKDHTKYVVHVSFSPSGIWLVSAGYDWKLHCYITDAQNTYSLKHTIHFYGAIESLSMLQPKGGMPETFIVGSRNDSNIHIISLASLGDGEPVRSLVSMNRNKDSWVSFTPMNISTVKDPTDDSWTVAVYTDLPSGKICFYQLRTSIEGPSAEATAKAAEGDSLTAKMASASLGDDSQPNSQWQNESFRLVYFGEACGTHADSFSRPKAMLLPFYETRHLILAATSDDSTLVLFDVASCATSVDGIARRITSLSGFGGIVRALDLNRKHTGAGANVVTLRVGSFDRTIRAFELRPE